MARTKLVAVLLGPSGVGLIGLYDSVIGLMGTLTGLGVGSSAVRQVAEAHGSGDAALVGRAVQVLRRVCWFTGFLGAATMAILARPLSEWTFGDVGRALPLTLLGGTLLLTAISNGQSALVRGVRRITDLARLQVLAALASLIISVALYAWLGERGIVPVFLVSALVNLGFSWWFARRVPVVTSPLGWDVTLGEASRLVKLGLAFTISGLCTFGAGWVARAWILHDFGLPGNGNNQSAFAISGVLRASSSRRWGCTFIPG